jgi:outer membrane protein W
MKKLAFVFLALVLVSSLAFSGDVAKSGEFAIQTSLGIASGNNIAGPGFSTLGVKYMLNDMWALRGEVGYATMSPANSNLSSSNSFGIGAGIEDHMSANGGVSPYWGVQFGYGTGSPSTASGQTAPSNPSTINFKAVLGGEYFFTSNFSWAGELGLGYWMVNNQQYQDANNVTQSGSTKLLSTGSATVILSWYIN